MRRLMSPSMLSTPGVSVFVCGVSVCQRTCACIRQVHVMHMGSAYLTHIPTYGVDTSGTRAQDKTHTHAQDKIHTHAQDKIRAQDKVHTRSCPDACRVHVYLPRRPSCVCVCVCVCVGMLRQCRSYFRSTSRQQRGQTIVLS